MNRSLSLKQTSRRLGICTRTTRELASRGELPGYRLGKLWRFDEARLEEFIRRGGTATSANKTP